MKRVVLIFSLLSASFSFSVRPTIVMPKEDVNAPNVLPKVLTGLGFEQKLKQPVPKDLEFVSESGKKIKLRDFFKNGRPVLMSLVYYGCPNICQLSISSAFKSLDKFEYQAGRDFEFVFVSIDPTEDSSLASAKKENFLKKYNVPGGKEGIHFLTGTDANIKKLADSVGFRYTYESKSKQYAHPSGVISFTPEGKISTYLYGIDFPRKDLRLAIVQASDNKVGRTIDRFLLFCYHYDPAMGRFGFVIVNLLKILGLLTVASLGAGIYWLRRSEIKKEKMLAS